MPKAKRADSIESVVKDVIDAAKGLPGPPKQAKLRPQDMPYWRSIVSNRARDDWTETELVACAHLARTQADIAEWTEKADKEPAVILSGHAKTPKPNVYIRMVADAVRRELALFRMLGLSTPASRDRVLRRQKLMANGMAGPDAAPGSGRKPKADSKTGLSASDMLA